MTTYFAHESAYVNIGDNTKIWHILSGTNIAQNCVVGPKVNNISIYEVEDDVFLGPSMVFTNVINPRAFIVRKEEFKKTILKKGCGVTIGEYALIGCCKTIWLEFLLSK